jgi:hypothetical protein
MKNLKYLSSILVAFLMIGTEQVFAQSDAQQKAWEAYMTPSENHKTLAKDVGSWKVEMLSYMEPNKPPVKSNATVEITMTMGGRYQQSVYKGDMMGMPFEGISVVGYDNAKKVFVNSWIDNMGTGMMYMEGTWDKSGKSVTYTGTCVNPETGKDMKVKQVMTFENDRSQRMEMYMIENGKENKSLEVKLTRQ